MLECHRFRPCGFAGKVGDLASILSWGRTLSALEYKGPIAMHNRCDAQPVTLTKTGNSSSGGPEFGPIVDKIFCKEYEMVTKK